MDLWVEAHRPQRLEDYVWRDADQRAKVEEWLRDRVLPHLLFSGVQGTGKTSLARLLLKELAIPPADILEINASRERQIDAFQERIGGFVGSWPMGETGIKYIILDEADRLSPLAQDLLKGEMERYADICRFILTCNQPQRLVPAIHSRCQGFAFARLDETDFVARLCQILHSEGVAYDLDTVQSYTALTYPDLRKAINLVQQGVHDKALAAPHAGDEGTKDYLIECVALFIERRFLDARKLLVASAAVEDYPEVYRYFYTHLDLFGATQHEQDDALLILGQGMVNHAWSADPEINLSATLVRLIRLSQPDWSKPP